MALPEKVNSGEESKKLKQLLGSIKITDPVHKKWLRYIKVEGDTFNVYAQPMVNKKLDPKEVERREKVKADKKEKRAKEKSVRDAQRQKEIAEVQKNKKKRYEEAMKKLDARKKELEAKIN